MENKTDKSINLSNFEYDENQISINVDNEKKLNLNSNNLRSEHSL